MLKNYVVKMFILSVIILLLQNTYQLSAQANDLSNSENPLLEECVSLINSSGYTNSGTQIVCERNYNLPSAYLIKCIKFEINGFPTKLDKTSCESYYLDKYINISPADDFYFEYQKLKWGPWDHYLIPEHLNEKYLEIKKKYYNKN